MWSLLTAPQSAATEVEDRHRKQAGLWDSRVIALLLAESKHDPAGIAEIILEGVGSRRTVGKVSGEVLHLNRLQCDVPGEHEIESAPRRRRESIPRS